MKPITREELEKWKQLAEAATAGPWELYGPCGDEDNEWIALFPNGEDSSLLNEADAEFIAAARDAVPRLVDEVERLEEIRGIVEHYFSPEIIGDEADKSIALLAIADTLGVK
jgi:hypothetical protein